MPHSKTKMRPVKAEPKKIALPAGRQEADAPIILPDLEEKIADEDAPVVGTEEDEESEETPTLDEEELNPFGDKWEQ